MLLLVVSSFAVLRYYSSSSTSVDAAIVASARAGDWTGGQTV